MFRANYLDIYHFVLPDDKGTHFPSQFSHPSRTLSAATRTCFSSVEERRCRRVYCSLSARRAAPRRTSYPAACGASTLIGSSTRTTACAFRQLLIGLSGQVVQVTSAPLRTVVAGRWGNSGQRHRRQLQQSPRVRHQADIERAGASAHGWMRDKRLLACPHGPNHRESNDQIIPGNLWSRTEERRWLFNHVGQNSTQGCVCASVETGTTLPLVAHPLGISAEDLLLFSPLLVCGSPVVRAEPWAARWVPKTRLPRRGPKWLTRTSEKTERRRPERWNCCSWVGHVWRFKTLWAHSKAAREPLKCWCLKFSLQSEQRRWWLDCISLYLARIHDHSISSGSQNCDSVAGLQPCTTVETVKPRLFQFVSRVIEHFWSWIKIPFLMFHTPFHWLPQFSYPKSAGIVCNFLLPP